MAFNDFMKNEKKDAKKEFEEKKAKISKIMNELLDVIEKNEVTLSEMSDIYTNLQVSYNRMLLDLIEEKK